MAILQALFALLSKSAGKILNAIFGWAVSALFGRTSAKERTFLSGLVAAAAAWPLLLVGVIAPKLAALLLAFIPIPRWVPAWTVRLVWIALVLIVPVTIGIAIAAKAPPESPRRSVLKRLLSGFPITAGLALAFLIMFLSVPVMRFWALLKGQNSADVPLMTAAAGYHSLAANAVEVLNRHGFRLQPAAPGWWVSAPIRVLRFLGGNAFGSFVPARLENYRDADLSLACYPSGILLRGHGHKLTWAHGLIAETAVRGEGFQTATPAAQDIEKQLRRLWKVYDQEPEAHAHSAGLLGRHHEITAALSTIDVDYEEWQVLYRQILQLDRALHGQPQLLDQQTPKAKQEAAVDIKDTDLHEMVPPPVTPPRAVKLPPPVRVEERVEKNARALSTVELVKEITAEVGHLAEAQLALAKAELRADIKAELTSVGGIAVAGLVALGAMNLLLVTAVLGLAHFMPAWAAGLLVSGILAAAAVIVAFLAWSGRVRVPFPRTRRALTEDIQWVKERTV